MATLKRLTADLRLFRMKEAHSLNSDVVPSPLGRHRGRRRIFAGNVLQERSTFVRRGSEIYDSPYGGKIAWGRIPTSFGGIHGSWLVFSRDERLCLDVGSRGVDFALPAAVSVWLAVWTAECCKGQGIGYSSLALGVVENSAGALPVTASEPSGGCTRLWPAGCRGNGGWADWGARQISASGEGDGGRGVGGE